MTDIRIELARPSDADWIARLSRDAIERGLGWSWRAERVARAIRGAESNVCIARLDDASAGFGIMRYGDERANLELLAVKTAWRRRGVARAIVDWLEAVAVTAGVEQVTVQLRQGNEPALALYTQLGFETTGLRNGYYQGREAALVMTKPLRTRDEAT